MTDKTYTITLTAEEKQIIENALYKYFTSESVDSENFALSSNDEEESALYSALSIECAKNADLAINLFNRITVII